MNDQTLPALADAAIAIAQAAGEAILTIYGEGYAVESKADDSPLTTADRAAHDLIAARLQALTPDIPVVSEEGGLADYAERRTWTRYWLVDPLDGTREFVKRNGEFTVNIALIENQRPVIGVVHAPVLGQTWEAMHRPAHDDAVALARVRRHDAEGIHTIQTRRAPAAELTLVVSRSHRHPQVEALLARLPAYTTRSMGSSLKFCLVAEGAADCYPRFGPTSEWDSAAAQCIVEAAGGAVIRPDGAALRYNTKASTLNPNFVVIGDPQWPWAEALDGLPVETR